MDRTKIVLITIIAVLVLILISVIATSLSDKPLDNSQKKKAPKQEIPEIQTQKDNPDSIMEAGKEDFMESCKIRPDMEDYCACAYKELKNNYNDNEIIDMYQEYKNTNQLPDEMMEVVRSCGDEL